MSIGFSPYSRLNSRETPARRLTSDRFKTALLIACVIVSFSALAVLAMSAPRGCSGVPRIEIGTMLVSGCPATALPRKSR
jgi:hypothetical protein